jgi:hypothetical protein
MDPGTRGSAVCYAVRPGAGRVVRVTKWQAGARTTYFVDDDGLRQHCSCPHHGFRGAICKHIRLVNLVESGRLRPGRWYQWQDHTWQEVGHAAAATAAQPKAQHLN